MPCNMKSTYTILKTTTAIAACVMVISACRSTYPTYKEDMALDIKSADLKHGEALVMSSCGGCHYVPSEKAFTGKYMADMPKILGKVYSANLTASNEYSPVPHYTNAELAYLLRTGIKRDGHFVPYMLRPNMSDKDIRDVVAYLRSGKGAVAPKEVIAGHTHLNLLGRWSLHIIGKPQPFRTSIPHPTTEVEQGRYLVDNIGCFHCHSKKATSLNYLHPEKTKGYMAGGATFKKPTGGKIHGPNLTMDKETGIGYYTKNDFRKAVQHMTAPNNSKLEPPMEAFHLTDKETDAIYTYLQTLPPKHHKVKGQERKS